MPDINTNVDIPSPTGILVHDATIPGRASAGAVRTLLNVVSGATANDTDANLRDRATHTGAQAQSTITGLIAELALKAPLANPQFTGVASAVTPPPGTNTSQLATMAALQAAVAAAVTGFAFKDSVRVKSTANVAIATALENGDTLNGVVLATGNRVLLADQTAPAENGIYDVPASGAATRSADGDSWGELVSAFVVIEEGTVGAETAWLCTVNAGGTLGTTPVTFFLFPTAGGGTASGTSFSPTGGISATNVQAAIAEVDAEKQPLDATLTSLAILDATAGIVEQTGADAFTKRAFGVGASTSVPTRADADTRYAAAAHAHGQADVTNLTADLALKAPLASPTFTGVPAAPTAAAATSTTQLATTAFATTADNLKANLASPTFTGTPAAPTAATTTNTTQVATTAFVQQELAATGNHAFGTIAVSGQSNVVADTPTDTLTIVAGSNITLTTSAAGDSVTIASSGGGSGTAIGTTFSPSGGISATNVQDMGAELDAEKQPIDATLTALAILDATVGLLEQTGADTFAKRAFGVGASTSVPTRADADNRYAAAAHTHAQSDVTNLTADLALKAPLASPTFTGVAAAPTAATTTNTTQLATTAFVQQELAATGNHAFGTVVVSGQSNVVADTPADTLTMVAGANITITTSAAGDSVTIAATGATGYGTVQEEGSALTQRATMNFVGGGITAADNAGSTRTDVTLNSVLNALATQIPAIDAISLKGTDIASATTTNIAAATGQFVHITGTTTITGLGTATAGVVRILRFAGILTFTHNATSLILPGGANITTAANDIAVMVSEGSGNWRAASYERASGASVAAASATASGSVELADITETSAGTDAVRAVTPDGLAGSRYGTVPMSFQLTNTPITDLAVGDGQGVMLIPGCMNGMDIVSAMMVHRTAGVGSTASVQVRRHRAGADVDVLSTPLTTNSTGLSSLNATPPVINVANDGLLQGDFIYIDVDNAHTTPARGTVVVIEARMP